MIENRSYTSCIKIGGKPIIPPLMTPNVRLECQQYRQKAIEIERKLGRNKLFQQCMEDLIRLKPLTEDLIKENRTITTLEHKLALDCDMDTSSSVSTIIVPSNNKSQKKLSSLTSETIDVVEYNHADGVRVMNDETRPKTGSQNPPRLIRSNSYTLESPSPILLAHLEKEARKCASSMDDQVCDFPDLDTTKSTGPVDTKCDTSQAYHLIETDISVQQVSVSTPMNNYQISAVSSPEKTADIEPQLQEILENLPADSASKIKEIFEKQRKEQLKQVQAHNELKNKVLGDNFGNILGDKRPNSLSVSSSQSLYYSVTSSADEVTPKTDVSSRLENGTSVRSVHSENLNRCNRRLFKDVQEERAWAASVICAAARGYLVRRLIRTEKVQVLIETIKDALLCAIQLHNAEVIDEKDVELHRRLIQQVSAACYAFHDVFFKLSTEEQMSIIALDRQRRIEKARRPRSASSARRSNSNSSVRSRANSVKSARS